MSRSAMAGDSNKDDNTLSEPTQEECEEEEEAPCGVKAYWSNLPKPRAPTAEEVALRERQLRRKEAEIRRRHALEAAGHRHMHLRWWRDADSWSCWTAVRDTVVNSPERLAVRLAREHLFNCFMERPPPEPQQRPSPMADHEWAASARREGQEQSSHPVKVAGELIRDASKSMAAWYKRFRSLLRGAPRPDLWLACAPVSTTSAAWTLALATAALA